MDDLIKCERCGSNACYKQEVNEKITNYMCYGCGFISNSLMKDNEIFWEEQKSILPELHKDLIFKINGKYWIPNTINIEDKGMVFANGKEAIDWHWAAVKAIKIKEEEKQKYPIPSKKGKFYEWRMDMSKVEKFKECDFMDALSHIGVLP
jgi:predicted HNH restriction endonuclease